MDDQRVIDALARAIDSYRADGKSFPSGHLLKKVKPEKVVVDEEDAEKEQPVSKIKRKRKQTDEAQMQAADLNICNETAETCINEAEASSSHTAHKGGEENPQRNPEPLPVAVIFQKKAYIDLTMHRLQMEKNRVMYGM